MSRIKQFPQCIFVAVEGDNDTDWLNAGMTKRDVLSGEASKKIAIYTLAEVQQVSEGVPVSRKLKGRSTA